MFRNIESIASTIQNPASFARPDKPVSRFLPPSGAVLLVGADPERRAAAAALMEAEGFETSQAVDAADAEMTLSCSPVDLILIDGRPTEGAVRRICQYSEAMDETAVVVLTDRPDPVEHIIALEIGADDCMAHSVDERLLMARIRALLRRRRRRDANTPPSSEWRLHPSTRQALSQTGRRVALTRNEAALLGIFLSNPGEVFTAERLQEHGFGQKSGVAIRTAISRLRRKLAQGDDGDVIHTVRGSGFVFKSPATAPGRATAY